MFSFGKITKSKVFDKRRVERAYPANANEHTKQYFEKSIKTTLDEVNVWHFSERVSIAAAGNIFKGLRNFPKSIYNENFQQKLGPRYLVYNIFFRKKIELKPALYIHAYFNLSDCYFHWMLDVLPRLLVVDSKLKEGVVLLGMQPSGYQIDTLKALGVANFLVLPERSYFSGKNILMPDFVAPEANYNSAVLNTLRDKLTEYFVDSNFEGFEKVYIARKKTSIRNVINESEVVALLEMHGYKTLYFEDYSFREQVNISNKAKVMISIHGAGLTNMLFMAAGTKIIEFKKEGEFEYQHYYNLANAVGLEYNCLFCTSDDVNKSSKLANLNVDINGLANLLKQVE